MSWFHGSDAGKTGQPATAVAAATARTGSIGEPYRLEDPALDADTSVRMVSRRVLCCCLPACVALLCACGSGTSAGEVQAWKVGAPYLPPPDPSRYARTTPDAAQDPAPAATRTPAPAPDGGRQPAGG